MCIRDRYSNADDTTEASSPLLVCLDFPTLGISRARPIATAVVIITDILNMILKRHCRVTHHSEGASVVLKVNYVIANFKLFFCQLWFIFS